MSVTITERRAATRSAGPLAVMVGPMGAGKTTVGRKIAERLDVPFLDADEFIEDITQFSIPDILETYGEPHFRSVEASSIAHLLSTFNGVHALGGGAITTASTRELLRNHVVVRLEVDQEHIGDRIGGAEGRPLLTGDDATEKWIAVTAGRQEAFAAVTAWDVDTNGVLPSEIADALAEKLVAHHGLDPEVLAVGSAVPGTSAVIRVSGERSTYDVELGRGILGRVAVVLPDRAERALIVHEPGTAGVASSIAEVVADAGRSVRLLEVPAGEDAKTAAALSECWEELGAEGLTRSDVIVGVGGGAVTDLAGFAAATWQRGIELVLVPTTVMGVVDASVGGKTSINTGAGKNLAGAFYPPRAVVADPDLLTALPEAEVASGLAEVVKAGLISDTRILEIIEADPARVLDTTTTEFAEVVERAVRVKADVVGQDPRESGLREVLNHGHTLGHAIERHEG
ncbi:iron-containing alcohol dehydrogenase [Actinomyces radicidentis]|uniref:iron-containing alcohol dehydrogenase n=1 Tax=Actinomyces radicidentis TaxID=111015 RepID=UPI0026E0CA0B|nr:iron-containing alcohol dehydrogenase [Actinomyces radicidentis]